MPHAGSRRRSRVLIACVFAFTVVLLMAGGGPSASAQTVLLTLNTPNPQEDACFGAAVAVGDVNGDGMGDIAVGVRYEDVGGNEDQGRAYVFSGADGSLLFTLNTPSPEIWLYFGFPVVVGDVNGDGKGDIVVGAHYQDVGGSEDQGRAYVFSGADASLLLTLDSPNPGEFSLFGYSLAVGEVNGDGKADIAVGAPYEDVGGNYWQGRAYVFSGADGSLLFTLDTPNPQNDAEFGESVAVGDVNGDGKADIAVGAYFEDGSVSNQGRAYVFSGADGSLLFTLDTPNPQPWAYFGASVAVGDANSDGKADIAVGAHHEDVGGNEYQGRAYVYSGADGSLLFTLDTPNPQGKAYFGASVAVGDVNGDGSGDIAVGAFGEDGGGDEYEGRVYVFSGTDGSLLLTLDSPNAQAYADFGFSVAVGEVNGDGNAHIAVGAPREEVDGNWMQGRAYVFAVDQAVPVLLVHGWRPAPDTWSTLTAKLDTEGIPYHIFDYSPGLGNPADYAADLEQWVEDLSATTGYTGKFDIVAHSMGAMVSRWYMEKRGGAENVRQWIGVAPVNHGAAIADLLYFFMDTLNKLFFFLPGYLDGSEPAVEAMRTTSAVLADLNYDEPDFNLSKWKTVPETLASGVSYKNLVGINSAGEPSFSPPTAGQTRVIKKDGEGDQYPYWTYQGDSVVPLYLSELQGVGTDCFEGLTHTELPRDSGVADRIILYLQDPSSPSLDNCPTSDPEDDHQVTGTGNRGILPQGEYVPIEVPVDSSVGEATVVTSWQGSELDLTLTSPSEEVMQPGVYPVVEYWQGGDSIWYVIDLPEPGVWTARIGAIDVPVEGEPYTFMTFYSSQLTLQVTTAEGRYSFDAGENATVVASLAEDDVAITGASVEAGVRWPDDTIDELVLYDDGSHGDALADDGDYTNAYALPMTGNYDFTVVASGSASEAFERTAWMTLWVEDLTAPVGGLAELPDAPGSSGRNHIALAGLAAAALLALTAGGWYARRRRLG